MNKLLIIILALLFFPNYFIFSQLADCEENGIVTEDLIFCGYFGLADFAQPAKELPVHFNNLIIKFDSTKHLYAKAANSHWCEYDIVDSNKIIFKNCIGTLLAITANSDSGYCYNPDIYYRYLVESNSFTVSGNEISFYKDSLFRLTIKPYFDFLSFPDRKSVTSGNVEEIKVSACKPIKKFIIINSEQEMKQRGVIPECDLIDFKNKILVIIRNTQNQYFPISYAKLSFDTKSTNIYLDVVNTYIHALPNDYYRRGEFTGIIIDKIDTNKMKLNITYTK